jgi:uncharacterized protein (TIGR03437 family)
LLDFISFAGDCMPFEIVLRCQTKATARFSVLLFTALVAHSPGWAAGTTKPAAAPAPAITAGGVVSASAFGGFTSIAPGSWIEIYGSNLAADTRSWTGSDFNGANAPTSLDGTSVTIGGKSAFVYYISPTQVDVQVPSGVTTGSQPVIVTAGGVASSPYNVTVNAAEPGLLAPPSFNVGGNQQVEALFPDGKTYVLPPGAIAGLPSRRAQPGDTILLYGVGFGPVTPDSPAGQTVQQVNSLSLPFQLKFGQTAATVTYAGLAPGAVGLYQFNVTVPSVVSSDAVPVTFTLGGVASTQTLYISVLGTTPATALETVTLSTVSVAGGGSVPGTLILSTPAPAGGAAVTLISSSTTAVVPSSVTVPAGSNSTNFSIATSAVTSSQMVTITAMYAGSSAQATLTVTPAASGLPQFNVMAINASSSSMGGPELGIRGIQLVGPPSNGSYSALIVGAGGQGSAIPQVGMYRATWNSVTVSGTTVTFGGLQTVGSTMTGLAGNVAPITSATLTVTLSPQGAGTSGTATGTLTLVSTVATISGSFTGTYVAR